MIGFDAAKYLEEQSKYILDRMKQGERLYLEFGGKLLFDMHAKRVLPGFDENAKIKLLHRLRDEMEVILVIYAGDIARNKTRQDFGITYDLDAFRMIDDLREYDLNVNSVVITRYQDNPAVNTFINKLDRRGIKTYKHHFTKGYPTDVEIIVSDEGYGANPFVKVSKPLVVITGPGPGSGKLATCLSQMYHEYRMGNKVRYAKFETFPIWDMPLKHPVNIAYEAATADLKDVNMIDAFHLEAHGEMAVNYNRDIEIFPVIKRIIEKITGEESMYKSPTDMGVNRIGLCITDDEAVKEASRQEIIRRYLISRCEYKKGTIEADILERVKLMMDELDLRETDRIVVAPAREYAELKRNMDPKYENVIAMAMELPSGKIITGRSSRRMVAAAAMILNAIKELAGMPDEMHLISPAVLEAIQNLKISALNQKKSTLNCDEVLGAVAVSAMTNPAAQMALEKLTMLKGCKAHCTAILSVIDAQTMTDIGIDVTTDPEYSSNNLYYS